MSAELFIEIRCEELPARHVQRAADGLKAGVLGLLKGIDHGAVRVWAGPRRVAVAVAELAAGRPVEEIVVTGPPERAAFRDGKPTKAAEGFARGRGVAVDELEIVDGPKGRVVAARVKQGGERTVELVADGLENAVLAIDFDKTMSWGPARWARPIHGVVALYGDTLVPATVAGVPASRETLGHRLTPGPLEVRSADHWVEGMRALHVIVDREERRAAIMAQLQAAGAAQGATAGELSLVDEVVDLVEWPAVVVARFEAELLDLPPRLLVESMGVHQRVFPLFAEGEDGQARLVNQFLVISNHPNAGDPACAATIAAGNARVLAARFHDARFFYAEDRKQRLEAHGAALAGMQWIRKAGTMADKAQRIGTIAEKLSALVGADAAVAGRAGLLCKADLATQMVGEFPELQGHVGRLLAGLDGEPAGVPEAIEEHYLPRFSDDALPASPGGLAVALADRIDTLSHTFRLGLKPKGSADPLGLRRAAGGVATLVFRSGLRIQLDALLAHGGTLSEDDTAALGAFVLARARAQLMAEHPTDLVDAVLATGDRDLVAVAARIAALETVLGTEAGGALRLTFKRVLNIVKDHDDTSVDPAAFETEVEAQLHAAAQSARASVEAAMDSLDVASALAALAALRPAVDAFFDGVMVMADDAAVRANRLGLLAGIGQTLRTVADFKLLS